MADEAIRRPAQEGRDVSATGVKVAVLPPAFRLALRAPAGSVAALSEALGLELPTRPKAATSKGTRAALWLGPDEWLVVDGAADPVEAVRGVTALHSAVDVSHRNVGLSVAGPKAAEAINAGCPQDLSLDAFPAGAVSRTILGKVEIVLYRTAADSFRVECWRSFSDYVFTFLSEAARDAAA